MRSAPVREVVKTGTKWLLDPYMCDMMWLYAKKHVARLLWDPGGWFWSHLGGTNHKGSLLSVFSETWKVITDVAECNGTSNLETLD